jgi:hypothetical protein
MARNTHTRHGVARRILRLPLCLALLGILLLSSILSNFHAAGGRAQSTDPRAGVKTEVVVALGLRRAIFTTPAGNKIFVNLPDKLAPDETCSGTVFAEPAGGPGSSRSGAANEFRGYTVELAGQKLPATGKTFELNLTSSVLKDGVLEIVLRGARGDVSGRAEFPVASRAPSRPADVRLPAFGKAGDLLVVECPCDGRITDEDFFNVGQTRVLPVAESRGKRFVFNNSPATGPLAVEFGEGGRVTKGTMHNLSVRLSVQKPSLMRGERTRLMVEVAGLEGLEEPASLSLTNSTPEVVTLEPANLQRFTIGRGDVRPGGRYTAEGTLVGILPGAFRIDAEVSRAEDRAAVEEERGTSAFVPPVAAAPGADAAARFEGGQEATRIRDELVRRIRAGQFPAPPLPEVGLLSPEQGAVLREPPTFRWRSPAVVPGDVPKVYYTLRIYEVSPEQARAEEVRKSKPLFEQSQLSEETFRFPARGVELTPGKVYGWGVTATDLGGRELAQSKLSFFALLPWPPFNFCWIIDLSPVSYCTGQGAPVTVAALFTNAAGPLTWTLMPQMSGDPPVSGNSLPVTIPPSLLPTTPGAHTYVLTITKGNCSRTLPVTVYAYPGAAGGAASVSPAQICDGGTAVLNVSGQTGSVGQWEYSDDGGVTWNNATSAFYIAGAPANTNQMRPSSCAAPNWYTDRQFRAVVTATNDPNAPSCSVARSTPTTLRIYCTPQAGGVTVSTPRYCRYSAPPSITLQLAGPVVGNVTWSPGGGTGSTVTISPAPTQTTTYTATISTGGSCPPITRSVTVVVDDQPFCTSTTPLSADKTLVCPGDAATLTLSSCTGYVTWQQSTTGPGGPWTTVSAGNNVQNTTDLFAPTYWQAVISALPGSGSVCPPIQSNVISIGLMTPPAAPVVTGPAAACFGSNMTLTTSPPPAGVTYTWYHDDLPVCSGGATCTVPAEPGNYWVEASNGCQTTQSNFLTVPIEEIKINLQAPCCKTTGPVTLSATATSSLTGAVGSGQFTWYQNGTPIPGSSGQSSITVNPSATSEYCVEVKSPTLSCSFKACTTVTVCP